MPPGEVVIGGRNADVRVQAATVIWSAGVKPSHLGQQLTEATGCDVDHSGENNTNPKHTKPNQPKIRIARDLCSYSHTVNGKPLPGMAAPAKQAGTLIGKDIAAIVSGGSRPTFRYVDFGSMAVVHASAVADLHGFKFSGRLGLLLWAIVHLALIPNRENRITLSIKWLYALATRQRASILLTGRPSQHLALDAEDAHFPMASGKGPSIAEPDAALKAAMDYYAHQLSGLPPTQELLDTKEASVADSEAAIK